MKVENLKKEIKGAIESSPRFFTQETGIEALRTYETETSRGFIFVVDEIYLCAVENSTEFEYETLKELDEAGKWITDKAYEYQETE